MVLLDYIVLAGYFVVIIAIGVMAARRIKRQEDFFMGGRSFGKLLQTFAAFGAGTGSADPVNTGRTTFTAGLSGMWSVMYWLFVTPFYWITGVWYRRMRHLTLGDWFVERYQSKAMGAGYCLFGITFFMVYGSMMFSAIGKVAAPLIGEPTFTIFGQTMPIEYMLVPTIGLVVLIYGIAGGLEAAYFTDLIQGLCIIALSVMLIPAGLSALVQDEYGPETQESMMKGFEIMHERLPAEHFTIVGSGETSQFPWYMILSIVLINLVGIVVQPHFIATGGGSAKTEMNARFGLVTGNFLKRFCTIGWVLTALIAIALYSDVKLLAGDPDKTWGYASARLLDPGLRGLMLACLLAALMSSVDAYMVVGSALVVRNIYAPYIKSDASEKQYLLVGRITGGIVVLGAVLISLLMMNVFEQLKLTWVFGVLFAAPFWIGMYWRRATKWAAWITVSFNAAVFFLIPYFGPMMMPELRTNPEYLIANEVTTTMSTRGAKQTDLTKRAVWQEKVEAAMMKEKPKDKWDAVRKAGLPSLYSANEKMELWVQALAAALKIPKADVGLTALKSAGPVPDEAEWKKAFEQSQTKDQQAKRKVLSDFGQIHERRSVGGESVFWSDGVKEVDRNGETILEGQGNFKLDFLLYQMVGMDLSQQSNSMLETLGLGPKIVAPFFVMIVFSLITPRTKKDALDRYYAKMKTIVDPDPEADQKKLEAAYANPAETEKKKLFPGSSLEFQKPTLLDIIGFIVCFAICFGIVWLASLLANIGS